MRTITLFGSGLISIICESSSRLAATAIVAQKAWLIQLVQLVYGGRMFTVTLFSGDVF